MIEVCDAGEMCRYKWDRQAVSWSMKRRLASMKILRSSRRLVFPTVLRGRDCSCGIVRSAVSSSSVRARRGYVNWPGIGAPVAFLSTSDFVGSMAKGWSGIRVSEIICCPASPKLVKLKSLSAWCHVDQLSRCKSRMIVAGGAAC